MQAANEVHTTLQFVVRDALVDQVAEFLLDRQARGLSALTIRWYTQQVGHFTKFLASQGTDDLSAVTPSIIRRFILAHGQDHNPGGVNAAYRAVRALCNWYADEVDGWKNPILKVEPPNASQEILEPVSLSDLQAILSTCNTKSFVDLRDKAVLLFLLDSGCRRAELCALTLADLDMATGAVTVRHGKGNKARMTFIGATTRKAMLQYLKVRKSDTDALWIDEHGERLSHTALRAMLERRAKKAGVAAPTPHSFRRGFALNSLRAGVDLESLRRLLGHSNMSVLNKYLAVTTDDLAAAHSKSSPVDRMLGKRR